MNLIRLIKLKKINGELDNLSKRKQLFISLFNNLIKINNRYYYKKSNNILILYFEIHEQQKTIKCSYSNVYLEFAEKYKMDNYQIINLMNDVIHNELNLWEYWVTNSFVLQ